MIKRVAPFIILVLVIAVFCSGCGTVKGAVGGTAMGMKEDYDAAKEVDDWMRKNLW